MHVHADYSLQLASLGASRNEAQEIAAKRSAEVRRKLSTAAGLLSEGLLVDAETSVSRVAARAQESQPNDDLGDLEESDYGRRFSARA